MRALVPAVAVVMGLAVAVVLFRFGASSETSGRGRNPTAAGAVNQPTPEPAIITTERVRLRAVTITAALMEPWALAFLPGGDLLVTERAGRLRLIHDGRLSPASIEGMPPVDTRAQDGLMDLALHPRFAENRTLYFTYSKPGGRGDTTALAAARLEDGRLTDVRDIFVSDAWSTAGGNSGSRIAFDPDGTIYMSVGERHEQTPAQDLGSHKGKILRLNDDGSVPVDNPFLHRAGVRPEIFAYGVRNPQGLFVDAAGGTTSGATPRAPDQARATIWEIEHGPRGGDELNVIERGHNYGWPAITFGINYNGTAISTFTAREGMDQPVTHWTPSISPSGLTIYSGDRFPAWRGNLFLGALSGLNLRRLELRNGRVTYEEVLQITPRPRRVRDVRQGPDGLLYVLTESGTLLRLEPASVSP